MTATATSDAVNSTENTVIVDAAADEIPNNNSNNMGCSRTSSNRGSLADAKELHIAPMIHVTDRNFRALLRILSKRCVLWTEMVADDTIANVEDLDNFLQFEAVQHPIVCQIGSNSPDLARKSAQVVHSYGFDEINLNCGCPSDRVANQREFGAALLKKVDIIVDTLTAIQETNAATTTTTTTTNKEIRVSIKTRIGVDDLDDLDFLIQLIDKLRPVCRRFVLHARKVHLKGLSAKQNRTIPPLNFPRVYKVCRRFPDCDFWINGGIKSLQHAKSICYGSNTSNNKTCAGRKRDLVEIHDSTTTEHKVPCSHCALPYGSCTAPPMPDVPTNLRGCMLGRAAMENVAIFWDVDRYFCNEPSNPCRNRRETLLQYCQYLERTYPRRCCDDDERVTFRYPPPSVSMVRPFCAVCECVYGGDEFLSIYKTKQEVSNEKSMTQTSDKDDASPPEDEESRKRRNQYQSREPGSKISSRLTANALKPVQSLFLGMPYNKAFKRLCHKMSTDLKLRNCGPAFILRRIMQEVIPDHILDESYVRSEDLAQAIS